MHQVKARSRLVLVSGFLTGMLLAGCTSPADDSEASSPGDTEWSPLQIVDVKAVPWDEPGRFGARTKTFFRSGPGSFVYIQFLPTWDTELKPGRLGPHYHVFHEWAYMLGGDYVVHEPVSPYQRNPPLYRFIEGTWLDRPAYTIHNGSWATGGLRAQDPGTMILFEEGDGGVVIIDPANPPAAGEPDWREVQQYARPWIVHSGRDLEWEQDTEVAGRMLKWLSDHQKEGFVAQLIKIPPGWTAPDASKRTYFRNAGRMRYLIWGDLRVWQYDDAEAEGKAVKLRQDSYVHQPPRSIWGYGDGSVSDEGAVWLEVTYARGLAVGGGPIEPPIAID